MQYKNPGLLKFKGTILGGDKNDGTGAFIYFPYDVFETFGVKGRVPVQATFDGIKYQGSLVRYSDPRHMIGILKSIREQLKKSDGDMVDVTIELDTSERKVNIPSELLKAFEKDKKAFEYFNSLSYSHQREYVLYIEEAKKEETRLRRVERTLEMLKEGKKLKN